MAPKLKRRKQARKHSGFGSLCWVGSESRWVVKGYIREPDGRVRRPRVHVFDTDIQTRGQAEYHFDQWCQTQRAEQALHLREPALDVRALCAAFVAHGIDEYKRGEKIATSWGLDKATADQWAAMQGDIRLAEYDGAHFAAFRGALDRLAARPRREGEKRRIQTRQGVNKKLDAARRIVKWGVGRKLCAPGLLEILRAVKGLSPGESLSADGEGRTACTLEQYEATAAIMPDAGRDALELIRWSAARPTEVLTLRKDELTLLEDDGIWIADKAEHKNAKKGKDRALYFNPAASETIERLLQTADPYLFSLARVMAEHPDEFRVDRRETSGTLPYDVLGDWVEKYAKLAGVPHWAPYQLRHMRLDEIEAEYGIEYAQAAGDHSTATMTANYVKRSAKKRTGGMKRIGALVGAEPQARR